PSPLARVDLGLYQAITSPPDREFTAPGIVPLPKPACTRRLLHGQIVRPSGDGWQRGVPQRYGRTPRNFERGQVAAAVVAHVETGPRVVDDQPDRSTRAGGQGDVDRGDRHTPDERERRHSAARVVRHVGPRVAE